MRRALWAMRSRPSSADASDPDSIVTTSAPTAGLPAQVDPPVFDLSAEGPHAVTEVEVVALPVITGEGDDADLLLGPGAEDLADLLGIDLLGSLEAARGGARPGDVVTVPVPGGTPEIGRAHV